MCDLFLFVGVRMAIWLLKSHEPVRGVAALLCSRFQIFHTAWPEASHGSCTIWEARRTSLASCNVSSSVDANF